MSPNSPESDPQEIKYIVAGRDGELREITEEERLIRDAELRKPYSGMPIQIGRIIRPAGTPNPPFPGTEEIDLNIN